MAVHDDAVKALQDDIKKTLEALKVSLSKIRTGRANLGMLDAVRVNFYGTPTPLSQTATTRPTGSRGRRCRRIQVTRIWTPVVVCSP